MGFLFSGDPNVALLLLAAGIAGLCFEFCAPGRILPGVVGASLCLMSAANLTRYSLNPSGVILVALACVFSALEARLTSRGLCTVFAAVSLFAGLVNLLAPQSHALKILWPVAALIAVPLSLAAGFLLSVAECARRNKIIPAKNQI